MTAGAWYSAKWVHAAPADGSVVMRCFAGREHGDPVMDLDDDRLTARLVAEVGVIAGARGDPEEVHLTRWPAALPQYEVGHLERVRAIEAALAADLPGVVLAGAGYRGSGLPDCIAQARRAARELMASSAP